MKIHAINTTGKVRGYDSWGSGAFGASRGGHTHQGVDFVLNENEAVKAPFDCKVVRLGYPYADTNKYRLVEIQGTGMYKDLKAKLMYVKELPKVGDIFKATEKICIADKITARYDDRMTNHVHLEIRKNGVLINPEKYL